jgi:hypothetical protein
MHGNAGAAESPYPLSRPEGTRPMRGRGEPGPSTTVAHEPINLSWYDAETTVSGCIQSPMNARGWR